MRRCTAEGIENQNGEGGLIKANEIVAIDITHNKLTKITSLSNGALMSSSNCGSTNFSRNCITNMKTTDTLNTFGQVLFITDQKESIHLEDSTAIRCPEVYANRYGVFYLKNSPENQFIQNNVSYCRLYATILLISSPQGSFVKRNSIANNTASIAYEMFTAKCTFTSDNMVGIEYSLDRFALFYMPGLGSEMTEMIFISVRQKSFRSSTSISLTNCLFFICSFSTNPDILTVTASTLPFTNTNTHFTECFNISHQPKTKVFTKQVDFELRAFLKYFIIEEKALDRHH